MKVIFLGAPGAGKGTQAEILSKRLGIPTISTGAIIRAAIKNGSPMGIEARKYTEKGELVPDEIVIGIIRERLAADDCASGFILDGFPRTVAQAEALDSMGITVDCVLDLEVGDDVIIERMSGRRVCDKCGATYHTVSLPPKDGANCDRCATSLTIRRDDAPEVVRERLRVYHTTTEPLCNYYADKGLLRVVEGQDSVEKTTTLTLAALGIE